MQANNAVPAGGEDSETIHVSIGIEPWIMISHVRMAIGHDGRQALRAVTLEINRAHLTFEPGTPLGCVEQWMLHLSTRSGFFALD